MKELLIPNDDPDVGETPYMPTGITTEDINNLVEAAKTMSALFRAGLMVGTEDARQRLDKALEPFND